MGSDGNKMNDGTSYQPSEPALCANGCGFFGSAATMNLCSKCFRDLRVQEEQTASAKAAMDKLVNQHNQTQSDGFPLQVGLSSAAASVTMSEPPPASVVSGDGGEASTGTASNRCLTCNKKIGVMGFKCKCGRNFCGVHRYPEKHDCEFDFKGTGRDAIAKANPVIKTDKVDRF